LAFTNDPDTNDDGDTSSTNIIVGCIAALSVFWNTVDRQLNYKSRADMHEAAKQVCKQLLASLDFTVIRYQSLSEEERKESGKPLDEQALDDLKTMFHQAQDSCTSSVPDVINQAFKRMNTLVQFRGLDTKSLDKAHCSEDVQALRIANILLCNEITKSWLWPMKLPRAAVTISAQKELLLVLQTKNFLTKELQTKKLSKKDNELGV